MCAASSVLCRFSKATRGFGGGHLSIHRKLGASSRSHAVRRVEEIGLLAR